MIEPAFMSVWNWDARPFPTFPALTTVWGDAGNWRAGQWLGGKGPYITPQVPDEPSAPPDLPMFPVLSGQGWSTHYRPAFATGNSVHVSGRESRALKMVLPVWEIELTFDVLCMDTSNKDFQDIIAFYDALQGTNGLFSFPAPACMNAGLVLTCRFAEDQEDLEEFMSRLFTLQSLKLRSIKGEGSPSVVIMLLAGLNLDCGIASQSGSEIDDLGFASDSQTLFIDLGSASL